MNTCYLAPNSIWLTTGQWRVPLDKEDAKKLAETKLSGPTAKKFIKGFDAIVDVCTAEHPQEFTDLWKITC